MPRKLEQPAIQFGEFNGAVPGLARLAAAFRRAFPGLTETAIRRILRMPSQPDGDTAGSTCSSFHQLLETPERRR